MNYVIRRIKPEEYELLNEFLYEAIFIPEGVEPLPKSIINLPEFRIYTEDFGKKDDHAFVAEKDGNIIGAVWTRIINDYGHIDDETPSLSISLYKEYRGLGIGTEMMRQMLTMLKEEGYEKVSLSVQKENYASKMYLRLGFEIVDTNNGDDHIMVYHLKR